MKEPILPSGGLAQAVGKLNHGCSVFNEGIKSMSHGQQVEGELSLAIATTVGVNALELLLKFNLDTVKSQMTSGDQSRIARAYFPVLLDLTQRYSQPPLDDDLIEDLGRYRAIRNQCDHEGAIPSAMEVYEALVTTRAFALTQFADLHPTMLAGPHEPKVLGDTASSQRIRLDRIVPGLGRQRPYLVTCHFYDDQDRYGLFLHEADIMLAVLGEAVQEGSITPTDARRYWWPYVDFMSEVYDPDFEKEWKISFPIVMGDWELLPGSDEFMFAADELGIPGVGFEGGGSPASGYIFNVYGFPAYEELCRHLGDRYKIRVRDEYREPSWSSDPAIAAALIIQLHAQPS